MSLAIVILTLNNLSLTQNCIESIHKYTHYPYRLYMVDQNSTDDTINWVRNFSDENNVPLSLILNKENIGFPKGCNQAFPMIKEDYICLLNNDTIVSPSWDRKLVASLNDLVLVTGPSTNRCGWRQQLVEYKDLPIDLSIEEVKIRAREVSRKYRTQQQTLAHLSGFCMIFTKQTLDEYGPFDEDYLLGGGEEVDFCWKITTSGKRCVWIKDVYIHHIHHATFNVIGVNMNDYRKKTATILAQKWPQCKRPKF